MKRVRSSVGDKVCVYTLVKRAHLDVLVVKITQ
jgi:hypothetical protein